MNGFQGVIIEESLADKAVLKEVTVTDTKVETVTKEHATPWLKQWTLHTVTLPENQANSITEQISHSLDPEHGGSWYADFKNDTTHYVIFRGKVFKVDRSQPKQYQAVKEYGLSLGIPAHQLDFAPDVKQWERN